MEFGSGRASTTRVEVGEDWRERICGSVAWVSGMVSIMASAMVDIVVRVTNVVVYDY